MQQPNCTLSAPIFILYTGGTLGMKSGPRGFQPDPNFVETLTQQLSMHTDVEYKLQCLEPAIDSANLTPNHWTEIAKTLISVKNDFSAFIILHGTDSLAYTASALSFMLRGFNKAVILTGSQIPLSEPRSDALDNLLTSLQFASQANVREVCICFNRRLLRGNRSRKVDALAFSAFDSPSLPWLGEAGIELTLNSSLLLSAQAEQICVAEFDPRAVTFLPIYPGIQASSVKLLLQHQGLQGVILQSYGVGNVPEQDRDFISALGALKEAGILLVNNSLCYRGNIRGGAYASSTPLQTLGVISSSDMTPEATFSKLHLLLATEKAREKIEEGLLANFAGELTQRVI